MVNGGELKLKKRPIDGHKLAPRTMVVHDGGARGGNRTQHLTRIMQALTIIPAFGRSDSWLMALRCDSFLPGPLIREVGDERSDRSSG
jgi:hypothetical protein